MPEKRGETLWQATLFKLSKPGMPSGPDGEEQGQTAKTLAEALNESLSTDQGGKLMEISAP